MMKRASFLVVAIASAAQAQIFSRANDRVHHEKSVRSLPRVRLTESHSIAASRTKWAAIRWRCAATSAERQDFRPQYPGGGGYAGSAFNVGYTRAMLQAASGA